MRHNWQHKVLYIFVPSCNFFCTWSLVIGRWYNIPNHLLKAFCVRYQWYLLNDVVKILFLMQKARVHYLEISRLRHVTFCFHHITFIFCIFFGHFAWCMEIFSGPEIRQIACIQGFQFVKCSHALDQSLETV